MKIIRVEQGSEKEEDCVLFIFAEVKINWLLLTELIKIRTLLTVHSFGGCCNCLCSSSFTSKFCCFCLFVNILFIFILFTFILSFSFHFIFIIFNIFFIPGRRWSNNNVIKDRMGLFLFFNKQWFRFSLFLTHFCTVPYLDLNLIIFEKSQQQNQFRQVLGERWCSGVQLNSNNLKVTNKIKTRQDQSFKSHKKVQ